LRIVCAALRLTAITIHASAALLAPPGAGLAMM